MYLRILKLWNFRKYGMDGADISNAKPGLTVVFKPGLNLLVGENDSGKSSVIDAVKHVLQTQTHEYLRLTEEDFYNLGEGNRVSELKVECVFSGFTTEEAANFLEWAIFDDKGDFELQVRLVAKRANGRILFDVKAGAEDADLQLDGNARDLLRVTYLKPLRDAENELSAGRRSRFAQILRHIPELQCKADANGVTQKHALEKYMSKANEWIEGYFETDKLAANTDLDIAADTPGAQRITQELNNCLAEFFQEQSVLAAKVTISGNELLDILNRLNLVLEENKCGLGTLNLLFIATELLLLQEEHKNGLRLVLVEEIEAHLHPQAQLRLIHYLKEKSDKGQYILTTHSTTLASTVPLENLLLCINDKVFPMAHDHTKLEKGDYSFLERFLDATKANLFFARGVILVEGDAEILLLPTLAEMLDRPLHKYGVSIVNVGGTAHLRYSKIFLRTVEPHMSIPVAMVRDIDVRPWEYYKDPSSEAKVYQITEDNFSAISELTQLVNFESMKGEIFFSKTAFLRALTAHKNSGIIPKQLRGDIAEKAVVDTPSADAIDRLREQRKTALVSSDEQNVKSFIADKWTLEYDIALSGIRSHLLKARLLAEEVGADNTLSVSAELMAQIESDVHEMEAGWRTAHMSPDSIAYKIYRPLEKGTASKSITAQHLARLLKADASNVKSVLKADANLKFIRDAIYHVTKAPAENGGDGAGNGNQ